MEEIKVGEYIRTDTGYIGKLERIEYGTFEQPAYHINNRKFKKINNGFPIFKCRIKKHSSNIIDLIEVGDYVNGNKIIRIDKDPFIKGQINLWIGLYEMDSNGDRWRIKYTNNEIKSIVTKEQFESVEYKLDN